MALMADPPPPDSPPPPPPSSLPPGDRQHGFDVEEIHIIDDVEGVHRGNADHPKNLETRTTAEELGKHYLRNGEQLPSTPPGKDANLEVDNKSPTTSSVSDEHHQMSLSDVVLQAKPKLITQSVLVTTSEVGGSKSTKTKDFSARLKRIKQTRVIKKGGNKTHSTESQPLHHHSIITSPEFELPSASLRMSPIPLPEEQEPSTDLERSLSAGLITTPTNTSPVLSFGNKSPPEHMNLFYSDELKNDHPTDGGPENIAPLQKSESPHLEGRVYNVPIVPDLDSDGELPSDLPPLPSSPPPSLPSSPPPDVPSVPQPGIAPLPPSDFLIPSKEYFSASPNVQSSQDVSSLIPFKSSSLRPPDTCTPPTDDTFLMPTEAPPLPPPNVPSLPPPELPPPDISLSPKLSSYLPSISPPSLLPNLSALRDDSAVMMTGESPEGEDKSPPSPRLSPGYVQFSTGGSKTTLGKNDEAFPGSDLTLTSNSSEQEECTSPHRPHSVVSMMSRDLSFQSNLRRWKVTNLAEADELFETRPASLPSSGKIRRIQSSIDPTTQSLSSSSRISGGAIDQSLDSITENPPDSPVKAATLIQQRLSSGTLFDGDVTVTRVAKTNWSLRDVRQVKMPKNEDIDHGQKSIPPTLPEDKKKEEKQISISGKEVKMKPRAKLGDVGKRKLRKKHTVSMNEGLIRSKKLDLYDMGGEPEGKKLDLYDMEGEPEGEGNLHKLNQSIPKSMSSLFDAVMSDIHVPGMADSSDEEEDEEEMRRQKEGQSKEEKPAESAGLESNVSSSKEGIKTPTKTAEHNGTVIKQSLNSVPKNPTAALPQAKPSTSTQSLEFRKKSSASNTTPHKPKGSEQDMHTKKISMVHKRNTGQRSGTLKTLKVYMQKIHPGLMYKMFLISTTTTAEELVIQGLEKANIVEDPRCFGLYEVYDSSQEALRILQDQDCPSSFMSGNSAPTHWELRRCRVHQSKTVQISTEHLSGTKTRSISLTISTSTTAGEVVSLALRKLHILKEGEILLQQQQQRNKYKMMMADNKAGVEWFLDDNKCLLDEMDKTESVLSVVDIYRYLLKGAEERKYIEETFPDDPNVTEALLKQSEEQLDGLRKELMVKDHTLNQLRHSLENARKTNEELQEDSVQPMKVKYKELQDSSARRTEELLLNLESTERKVKERDDSLQKLVSQKGRIEKDAMGKDAIISELRREVQEMEMSIRSLSLAQEELKKAAEEDNMSEETAKDAVISELRTMVQKMESSVLELSSAHQEIELTEAESEGEMPPDVVELIQKERDSLVVRISELEKENEQLRKRLRDKENTECAEEGKNSDIPQMNLFSLLGNVLKQTVLSVEALPTEQGLGVKLANNMEGIGCVVKTVAETSSAKGILQPGDRLLEVNGHIVKSHSHKDIVGILQKHYSGPVQLVVSRSFQERDEGEADLQLKRVTSDLEEKLAQQLSLNEERKDENMRLRGELKASVSAVSAIQDQLRQKEAEVTQLKEEYQHCLSMKQNDLMSHLREQLSTVQSDEPTESLADNLKNAKQDEILEVLRTVETECLKHKNAFEQLLKLIVSHNPELLQPLADEDAREEDEEFGWC